MICLAGASAPTSRALAFAAATICSAARVAAPCVASLLTRIDRMRRITSSSCAARLARVSDLSSEEASQELDRGDPRHKHLRGEESEEHLVSGSH
jgi:hypothetical protein